MLGKYHISKVTVFATKRYKQCIKEEFQNIPQLHCCLTELALSSQASTVLI